MRAHTLPWDDDHQVTIIDLPPAFPVVLPLCRELQIAHIVDRLCPMEEGAHLTHGQVVEMLVLHLLHAPKRLPLYKVHEWAAVYNTHELWGHQAAEFNDDRLGRTLDAIADSIGDIEACVVTRALQLYGVNVQAIHWDLTHVTFSKARELSELVCTGFGGGSVQVSLHVTDDGAIPIRHAALAGNAHQSPLMPEMLKALQAQLQRSDLIVVSDRAGICYDNIVAYRAGDAHFLGSLSFADPRQVKALAAVPQSEFRPLAYRSLNAPLDFDSYYDTTIWLKPPQRQEPIQVRALYIDSDRRRQLAQRQRRKQVDRCLEGLSKIAGYLNQRRYAKASYTKQRLEKAVPEALRSIVLYEFGGQDDSLSLSYRLDEEALAQAPITEADGRWILLYDLPDEMTADGAFALYRRQSSIEARIRNFNQELSVHPLWLQKDDRILALLLVFILALLVYSLLELRSERAGLDTEWYHKLTAREMIHRFDGVRVIELHIRGKPPRRKLELPEEQRHLLRQLGLSNPALYLT